MPTEAVLIAEDYPDTTQRLERCLCEAGFEVMRAGDVKSAGDYLKTHKFVYGFFDIHLPLFDGAGPDVQGGLVLAQQLRHGDHTERNRRMRFAGVTSFQTDLPDFQKILGSDGVFDKSTLECDGIAELLRGTRFKEVVCGEVRLPLRKTAPESPRLYREVFGVNTDEGDEILWARQAVRRFLVLEDKAGRAMLTPAERMIWERVAITVDRAEIARRRARTRPSWMVGQIIAHNEARRVQWAGGRVTSLSKRAWASVAHLEVGDWFDADVFENQRGQILRLANIQLRPGYGEMTQDDVNSLFGGSVDA